MHGGRLTRSSIMGGGFSSQSKNNAISISSHERNTANAFYANNAGNMMM